MRRLRKGYSLASDDALKVIGWFLDQRCTHDAPSLFSKRLLQLLGSLVVMLRRAVSAVESTGNLSSARSIIHLSEFVLVLRVWE
jgi:hypothetical protein